MNPRGRLRVMGAAAALVLGIFGAAPAQQSPGFGLTEHTLNSGGHPGPEGMLESGSFRMSLDAIGDPFSPTRAASSSYSVSGSFVGRYPPPGEVIGLHFRTKTLLTWHGEPSTGVYDLYRDDLNALAGGSFGQCFRPDLPETEALDVSVPAADGGYFYLVTARNRLREEGTKGESSNGVNRGGAACP